MSTDQYTPDELAFLDKALVGIATGVMADPDIVSLNADGLAKDALVLLDARRKIRGDAVAIDKASANALRSVRSRFEAISSGTIGDTARINSTLVFKVIDEAIAALAPIASNEVVVHEFGCNENMIRAEFHIEHEVGKNPRGIIAFNGSRMGFDSIPTHLALAPGDIVEIRVIERADR